MKSGRWKSDRPFFAMWSIKCSTVPTCPEFSVRLQRNHFPLRTRLRSAPTLVCLRCDRTIAKDSCPNYRINLNDKTARTRIGDRSTYHFQECERVSRGGAFSVVVEINVHVAVFS